MPAHQNIVLDTHRVGAVNEIYAIVHDYDTQALKFVTSTWQLAAYTAAAHDDFGITLTEDSEISGYHKVELTAASIDLPELPQGEYYWIEFWEADSAPPYVRSTDTLFETRKLHWNGLRMVSERDPISFISHMSVVYDAAEQKVRYCAWLERNGELQEDAQQAVLSLWDSAGSLVESHTIPTAVESGIFYKEGNIIALNPDEVYIAKVTIRDNVHTPTGDDHSSGACIVTWD